MFEAEEESARRILEEASERLRKAGASPRAILANGHPPTEIAHAARSLPADLVVMGSHGYGAAHRLFLGSVADAVKNRAPSSLLIAKGPPPPRRVLLAVDGSRASKRAAALGLRLRGAFQAKATLLHVISFPVFGASERGLAAYERAVAGLDLDTGDPGLDYEVQYGRPSERIVETARSTKTDLLVMGYRGLETPWRASPGAA